jgi:glycosyltransferase involved in cell wall biosynthesis
MRVLHVTHQYPPAIGGAERYIADLSEDLARRGHQVDVFTSQALNYRTWKNESSAYEQHNGVNIHRFRSLRRGRWTWRMLRWGVQGYGRSRSKLYEPLIFLGSGPLCLGMFWTMLRRCHEYDLVHLSCSVYSHVAYGFAAARRCRVPVVVTPHAHTEQLHTYGVGYMWRVLRESDHVMAQTSAERAFLIEQGLDPWCVTTGGVGLDAAAYPPLDAGESRRALNWPKGEFVMLFLGRKTSYKGLDVALAAYAALRTRYPRLRFVMAGPDTSYSRALLAQYSALPGLVNLGTVSNETKLHLLNGCDCLVLPSTGEALGYVFLEAWMYGKPVVGARTASVSTVVDEGRDGFLIRPSSAAELAARIARWIEDAELGQRMGQRGRDKVRRRYTVSHITDVVEGVYLRVLRARARAEART